MDSSQPPPRAKPFTAAMVGLVRFSSFKNTRLPSTPKALASAAVRVDIWPMSAPATKERPAPVITATRMLSSASTWSSTASSSRSTWSFRAFRASGRFMVIRPTGPRCSNVTKDISNNLLHSHSFHHSIQKQRVCREKPQTHSAGPLYPIPPPRAREKPERRKKHTPPPPGIC